MISFLREFWAGPRPIEGLEPGKTAVLVFGLNAYGAEKLHPSTLAAQITFNGVTARQELLPPK